MARYASFCLIIGLFKGEVRVFARLYRSLFASQAEDTQAWLVRVKVSFMTEAVWSAILATAELGFLCVDKILKLP